MGSLKVFYNVGPFQNKVIDRDYKLAIKKVEIFGNQNLPDTFHNYDMSNNNFLLQRVSLLFHDRKEDCKRNLGEMDFPIEIVTL